MHPITITLSPLLLFWTLTVLYRKLISFCLALNDVFEIYFTLNMQAFKTKILNQTRGTRRAAYLNGNKRQQTQVDFPLADSSADSSCHALPPFRLN